MHEIDLSRARVGDSVRSVLNGWGEVKMIRTGSDYPIEIEYPHQIGYPNWKNYAYNGRQLHSDLYPEIVEWQPQKRKVKKEITGFANIYIYHEVPLEATVYLYKTEERAKKNCGADHMATPCTVSFEVDE